MAIAEVGGGSQRAASGNNNGVAGAGTLAYPANVTAGSLLVVAGAVWGSASAPTSVAVTDTRGTSYTVVLGTVPTGLTWRTFIAHGVAPSSGANTVSVDPQGTSSFSFSIDEFGAQSGAPSDVDGGTTTGNIAANASFTASDTVTTVAANALVVGVASQEGATRTLSAGTGNTLIGANSVNSNNQCHAAVFQLATTPGTYTAAVNAASATDPTAYNPGWACQSYSFKPAVAPPFARRRRFFTSRKVA
jgi:hypothetical protein